MICCGSKFLFVFRSFRPKTDKNLLPQQVISNSVDTHMCTITIYYKVLIIKIMAQCFSHLSVASYIANSKCQLNVP